MFKRILIFLFSFLLLLSISYGEETQEEGDYDYEYFTQTSWDSQSSELAGQYSDDKYYEMDSCIDNSSGISATSGDCSITSRVIDLGEKKEILGFFQGGLPLSNEDNSRNYSFYVRTGNTSSYDSNWSNWNRLGNMIPSYMNNVQYLQYKIVFETTGEAITKIEFKYTTPKYSWGLKGGWFDNNRYVSGESNITDPTTLFEYNLGGTVNYKTLLLAETTTSGRKDYILGLGGKIVVKKINGDIVYTTNNYALEGIVGIYSLDQTPSKYIFAYSQSTFFLFDVEGGKTPVWAYDMADSALSPTLMGSRATIQVRDLDADGYKEIIVIGNYDARLIAFSFIDGIDTDNPENNVIIQKSTVNSSNSITTGYFKGDGEISVLDFKNKTHYSNSFDIIGGENQTILRDDTSNYRPELSFKYKIRLTDDSEKESLLYIRNWYSTETTANQYMELLTSDIEGTFSSNFRYYFDDEEEYYYPIAENNGNAQVSGDDNRYFAIGHRIRGTNNVDRTTKIFNLSTDSSTGEVTTELTSEIPLGIYDLNQDGDNELVSRQFNSGHIIIRTFLSGGLLSDPIYESTLSMDLRGFADNDFDFDSTLTPRDRKYFARDFNDDGKIELVFGYGGGFHYYNFYNDTLNLLYEYIPTDTRNSYASIYIDSELSDEYDSTYMIVTFQNGYIYLFDLINNELLTKTYAGGFSATDIKTVYLDGENKLYINRDALGYAKILDINGKTLSLKPSSYIDKYENYGNEREFWDLNNDGVLDYINRERPLALANNSIIVTETGGYIQQNSKVNNILEYGPAQIRYGIFDTQTESSKYNYEYLVDRNGLYNSDFDQKYSITTNASRPYTFDFLGIGSDSGYGFLNEGIGCQRAHIFGRDGEVTNTYYSCERSSSFLRTGYEGSDGLQVYNSYSNGYSIVIDNIGDSGARESRLGVGNDYHLQFLHDEATTIAKIKDDNSHFLIYAGSRDGQLWSMNSATGEFENDLGENYATGKLFINKGNIYKMRTDTSTGIVLMGDETETILDMSDYRKASINNLLGTDIDGDGTDDIIFATDAGYIIAVNSNTMEKIFSYNIGFGISDMILTDTNKDDLLEIIAVTDEGKVIAIGNKSLTAPIYVYDGYSQGEDTNLMADQGIVGANWGEVYGATGYNYKIVIQSGDATVDFIDRQNTTNNYFCLVGNNYDGSIPDGCEELGSNITYSTQTTYVVMVQAYNTSGVSPIKSSDGFSYGTIDISKLVKGPSDTSYKDSTEISPGSIVTYKIRIQNNWDQDLGGEGVNKLVIYDYMPTSAYYVPNSTRVLNLGLSNPSITDDVLVSEGSELSTDKGAILIWKMPTDIVIEKGEYIDILFNAKFE